MLLLAAALLAVACGDEGTSSPSPTTAGAFSDYPPFSFVPSEGGEATGIAVDYWNLMAYRLGVGLELTPILFTEQIEGLKDGRFDSLTGIFPLPEREQWFAFSRAWFMIDTRIYTDAGHTADKTLQGLKGLTVAVVAVGKPVAGGEMTLPVRKDETMLLQITNKGISMVGEAEFQGIYETCMGEGGD